MSLIVSSIVGGVNEKIAFWINVRAYVWTDEKAIIASKVPMLKSFQANVLHRVKLTIVNY